MKTLKKMYLEAGLTEPNLNNFNLEDKIKQYEDKNYNKHKIIDDEIFFSNPSIWEEFQENIFNNLDDDNQLFLSEDEILENEVIYSSKIEGIEISNDQNKNSKYDNSIKYLKEASIFLSKQDLFDKNTMKDIIIIFDKMNEGNSESISGKNYIYRNDKVGIFKNINGKDVKIHSGLNYKKIDKSMENIFVLINGNTKTNNPFEITEFVSLIHVVFEYIHPFFDGNGRIGRMMIQWILSKTNFPETSYLFSELISFNKSKYYKSLEHSQKTKLIDYHSIFLYNILAKSLLIFSTLQNIYNKENLLNSQLLFIKRLLILDIDNEKINYPSIKDRFSDFSRQSFHNKITNLVNKGIIISVKDEGAKLVNYKLANKYILK